MEKFLENQVQVCMCQVHASPSLSPKVTSPSPKKRDSSRTRVVHLWCPPNSIRWRHRSTSQNDFARCTLYVSWPSHSDSLVTNAIWRLQLNAVLLSRSHDVGEPITAVEVCTRCHVLLGHPDVASQCDVGDQFHVESCADKESSNNVERWRAYGCEWSDLTTAWMRDRTSNKCTAFHLQTYMTINVLTFWDIMGLMSCMTHHIAHRQIYRIE